MYATSQVGEPGAQFRRTLARGEPVIAPDHSEGVVGMGFVWWRGGQDYVARCVRRDGQGIGGGRGRGGCVGCVDCVGGGGCGSGAVNRGRPTHL